MNLHLTPDGNVYSAYKFLKYFLFRNFGEVVIRKTLMPHYSFQKEQRSLCITFLKSYQILLLGFLLYLIPLFGHSQDIIGYKPFVLIDTIPQDVFEKLKNRLALDKGRIKTKGKVASYIKTLYEQRSDFVLKTFNENYFMNNDEISHYVQKILDKIYDANPDLPRETNLYPYRSAVPNALSFGEGTLSIMLGLLTKVETEDVLAFIICHELAHYHSGHADKKIEEIATLNYDKALRKQIDDILSSPYGKYTKLKSLFSTLDISMNKHSREIESEADSIALTYFLKTDYNKFAPLRCMQILQQADSSMIKGIIDLRKYFDNKEFPFKPVWSEYTKSDVWHVPSPDEIDSLRTHPNCLTRFKSIQRQLGITSLNQSDLEKGIKIPYLTTISHFELVNSLYEFKQFGKCLYHSLILAEKFPDHPYPHAMICKSLYQLFKAQKDHTLAKVLEQPDPRFEENYDRILSFIHKLRLFELASLASTYSTTQPASYYQNEEFLHAVWLCSKLQTSKLDPLKVKKEYLNLFPNGKYINEMNNN